MTDQILNEIFNNPKSGYPNATQLYKKAKEKLPSITNKEVKEFYNKQSINQIFKPNIKPNFEKIRSVYDAVGTLQADLLDVNKWMGYNRKIKFLLNVVDIYSRYAWSFPMTSKKSEKVVDGLKIVYDEIKLLYPNNKIILEADNGSEFKGMVSELNKKYKVEIWLNNPSRLNQHTSMSIVERFNRTLLTKISKFQFMNNTLTYINNLQDLVEGYNDTEHSTIREKPSKIFKGKRRTVLYQNETDDNIDLEVGDLVRLVEKREGMRKKSISPTLSTEIYEIIDIIGNRYLIMDLKTGEELDIPLLLLAREIVKIPFGTDDNEYEKAMSQFSKEKKVKDTDAWKPNQRGAGIEGNQIILRKANNNKNKYYVIVNNKKVYFGAEGYSDFILSGGDKMKKKNYIARHSKNEDWSINGIFSKGFWSRYILWNKKTIQSSIKDIEKKFGVKIKNET